MSFPAILYVLKETGSMTKVLNALAVTRKPVLWAEDAYRDIFGAAQMGAAIPNKSTNDVSAISGAALSKGTDTTSLYLTQVPATITPGSGAESVSISDDIGHYPWRIKQYIRYRLQFWDAATVGHAMTMSVTTVSGSATITVSNNERLTPGQGISGSGIPSGAKILKILPISEGLPSLTSVLITHQATASATVEATLTGANLLAEFFEDEIIDWGAEISFPS